MYFIILFYHFFSLSGKNNTHPLKNNDEISLSLKKHKGKEFICILTSTFHDKSVIKPSSRIRPTFSGKESVTSSALLHQSGTTAMQNHSYKNAAVEKKNHLKFIFAGLVVPPFFVSMTTDLMLGRQFSLTLAGCLNWSCASAEPINYDNINFCMADESV